MDEQMKKAFQADPIKVSQWFSKHNTDFSVLCLLRLYPEV
jgi:hypothetical protein